MDRVNRPLRDGQAPVELSWRGPGGKGYTKVSSGEGDDPTIPPLRERRTRTLVLTILAVVSVTLILFRTNRVGPPHFCPVEDYSNGTWVLKDPPLHANTSRISVEHASGFKGCAHAFKPEWYFGAYQSGQGGEMDMDKYRWDAAQWTWKPNRKSCRAVEEVTGEMLVRDLVENGGWLLLGDSLTEEQFFSLSCFMYPHVRVDWGRKGWEEQHMYLRSNTPLYDSLKFPPSFSLDYTPLVTNLRTDQGFSPPELRKLYHKKTPTAQHLRQPLTTYPVASPSFDSYISTFLLDRRNYRSLIMSMGSHFTPREFNFGMDDIFKFFKTVVEDWVSQVKEKLDKDPVATGQRRVIVRSATSGHGECKSHFKPYQSDPEKPETEYNWGWMDKFNDVFKTAVSEANHPQISFLSLERPAKLRPDGHAADCLHISVGLGIIEGWTKYLYHYLTMQRRSDVVT
ncbi:hypothetical protein T439DRAFT_380870 [Meredithblackwellia eburnea MCA 4105]